MFEVLNERINTSRRMLQVSEAEIDTDYLVNVKRNNQLIGNQ